jgi:hypothetical protein
MQLLLTQPVIRGLRRKRIARRVSMVAYGVCLASIAGALSSPAVVPLAMGVFLICVPIAARATYVFVREPCPNCQREFSSAWFFGPVAKADILFRKECEHCRASITRLEARAE